MYNQASFWVTRNLKPFALACFCLSLSINSEPLLWSSTGGGWRAMTAAMGFANLFQHAGLFDIDGTAASTKNAYFASIATTSGSAWFSTQFFYSQAFNNITLYGSPQELHDFVVEWMNEYLRLSNTFLSDNETCPFPDFLQSQGDENPLQVAYQYCDIFIHYNGDWAAFVNGMLGTVAANVYNDEDFTTRIVNRANRVSSLQTTDLLIQTALAPTTRLSSNTSADIVYLLGPSDDNSIIKDDSFSSGLPIYTTFLPAVLVVDDSTTESDSYFVYGGGNLTDGDFLIYKAPFSPRTFDYDNYQSYGLYPGTNGSVLKDAFSDVWNLNSDYNVSQSNVTTIPLSAPFGGSLPTTVQIASVSSAASGGFSPLIPSSLAQATSPTRYKFENNVALLNTLDLGLRLLYKEPLLFDTAVCSQWPDECGEADGRFADGGYIDTPSLPMNLAHYQRKLSTDDLGLQPTLKIIVTDTNVVSTSNSTSLATSSLLSYFSTEWNQGIAPGEFVWAPGQISAWASPQVFAEYMNTTQLQQRIEPISGSNITTIMLNATTVENPVFQTRPGLSVSILWIQINSAIPSAVIGASQIELYTNMTAELAKEIASNTELHSRVQDFVKLNFTRPVVPDAPLSTSGDGPVFCGAPDLSIYLIGFILAVFIFNE